MSLKTSVIIIGIFGLSHIEHKKDGFFEKSSYEKLLIQTFAGVKHVVLKNKYDIECRNMSEFSAFLTICEHRHSYGMWKLINFSVE